MRRRVWWMVIAGVLAAFLVGSSATAAAPYPPPADAGATVTPQRVQAGGCVLFAGRGFEPSTSVAFEDNAQALGSGTIDEQGAFSRQVCFDATAAIGRHVLSGTGRRRNGSALVRAGSQASRGTGQLTVTAVVYVTGVVATDPDAVSSGRGTAGLPRTGLDAIAVTAGGLLLVASGSLLLLATERRRRVRRNGRIQAA